MNLERAGLPRIALDLEHTLHAMGASRTDTTVTVGRTDIRISRPHATTRLTPRPGDPEALDVEQWHAGVRVAQWVATSRNVIQPGVPAVTRATYAIMLETIGNAVLGHGKAAPMEGRERTVSA